MAGGLIDSIVDMGKGFGDARTAKKNAALSRDQREMAMKLFQSQNHQPELASRHIGTYQRSRSPVADAFLESLLTGQAAGAVQGTRAGAAGQQRAAQRGFDASTGGFDALRARQSAMQDETPWEVRGFNRDVTGIGRGPAREWMEGPGSGSIAADVITARRRGAR